MKKNLYYVAIAVTTISFLGASSLNAQEFTKEQKEIWKTAETATQTDWSGGPGIAGPVTNWGNTFDMESGVSWYSSIGALNLVFSGPMEHLISGGYGNVNHAVPVDMDGDGDNDVLGAAGQYSPPYFFSGSIYWWENTDGAGISWVLHAVDNNFTSRPSICSADLDGDGDMDVVGGARGTINDLVWWENIDGSGTSWTEHVIPSSIQHVSSVDTADVNGDGYVDLLSTEANTKVVWIENVDGSGINWTEHIIGYNNLPYDIYGADIDGDEDIDVVVPAYNGDYIRWWENVDGSGITWNGHDVASDFNGARSVFAADVDGDDDIDILGAASLEWAISWWENSDGYGNSWIEHTINSNFNWAYSVFASDMDDDGDTDVLGAAYFGDDITWWENTDGLGLSWNEHLVDGNFDGAVDVASADMDNDGDPDILGAAQEDADITWWDVTCCIGAGELVSSILDTETGTQWDSLSWTSDEPAGTSIYFQVRSSMDPLYMGDWSTDITTPGNLQSYLMDGDRYVQYKVFLETTNPGLSPVLEDVILSWNLLSPISDFSATPTIGYAPLDVQFTDLSMPGANPITSWTWDFGDGNNSSDQNPMHIYSSPGFYTVMLTVSDGTLSATETKISYISVFNTLVVDAGTDQSIPAGTSTTLEGSFTGGSGDVQILWTPESLIVQQGILDPQTLDITQDTTFYLTVTDLIIGDGVVDSVRIEVFIGMEEIITEESINIYLNPITHQITLTFDLPVKENTVLEIFDISGRKVLSQKIPSGERLIHITGLKNYPGGIYVLSIRSPTFSKQKKLIH